MLEGEH